MKLAILQSNYIPWKGYFDIMNLADEFIVYDSAQYTKNDWRNRNLLRSKSGTSWLTIPVATAGRSDQRINEAVISDPRWARKHWATVDQLLRGYEHFDLYKEAWREWYDKSAGMALLHEVNMIFLQGLAAQLGLQTRFRDDREFVIAANSPTGRLVDLCRQVGAESYVTGPSALSYLELERFHAAGIRVDVVRYDSYPKYSQQALPFDHRVSVLDLLASEGPAARRHLLGKHFSVSPSDLERSEQ